MHRRWLLCTSSVFRHRVDPGTKGSIIWKRFGRSRKEGWQLAHPAAMAFFLPVSVAAQGIFVLAAQRKYGPFGWTRRNSALQSALSRPIQSQPILAYLAIPCHAVKDQYRGDVVGLSAVRSYVGRPPAATASCLCRPDRARLDHPRHGNCIFRLPRGCHTCLGPLIPKRAMQVISSRRAALASRLPSHTPNIKSIA